MQCFVCFYRKRTAKTAAERAQLNLFHPNASQSSAYFRPTASTDVNRVQHHPQHQTATTGQNQQSGVFQGAENLGAWHPQSTPSDTVFRPFSHTPPLAPAHGPASTLPPTWLNSSAPRPAEFEAEEEGGTSAAWEVALSTSTEPIYVFENGSIMTDDELIRAGLGPWIRALTWFGWQLLELAMGDHSTIAGLSALVLINYQALSGEFIVQHFKTKPLVDIFLQKIWCILGNIKAPTQIKEFFPSLC